MKKLIATVGLMGIILMGNAAAKTGIFMADFQSSDNPQPQTCSNSKMITNSAIFVTAFTAIFVTAFEGIIVIQGFTRTDSKTDSKAGCRI